jgi:hypothetical protein
MGLCTDICIINQVAGAEKTAQAALAAVVFYSSASDQADADDELARAELLGMSVCVCLGVQPLRILLFEDEA